MSHADPGPLASYNSLQDKNLSGYFSTTKMKKHLKRSGLVTKKGNIIDEKTYRLNMAKKEHRRHVRDLLATAIVHKALNMERVRQYEIRKRLDDVYKVELVRRVREGRSRKGDEEILPLLSPRERMQRQKMKDYRERPATAPAGTAFSPGLSPSELQYDEDSGRILYRVDSDGSTQDLTNDRGYLKDESDVTGTMPYTKQYPNTYPVPAPPPTKSPRHKTRPQTSPKRKIKPQRFHYLARTEPAVAHRVQLQSMAEVTMKFLGPSIVLTNSLFTEDRLSEVMILQQHCGGSTLCVFRELLPPNTVFTFISRRHRGAPFGLTFYIDSLQDIRLSSCCEYKHKPGHVLGGKNGHFQFVQVEGAAPCYRCQVASQVKGSKSKSKSQEGVEANGNAKRNSKAFMTEADQNGDGSKRETFDVIITRVEPGENQDDDEPEEDGEKIDSSTQTPGDKKSDNDEEKEAEEIKSQDGSGEETVDKENNYDEEVFEDDHQENAAGKEGQEEKEVEEEQEEENIQEKESDTEKSDSEKDKVQTDYGDDFEAEEDKKPDDSGSESEDEKEGEKDSSDSSSSSSSSSSDDSSDDSSDEDKEEKDDQGDKSGKESEEEIEDETVTKRKKETDKEVASKKDDESTDEDIEDETVDTKDKEKVVIAEEEEKPEWKEVKEEKNVEEGDAEVTDTRKPRSVSFDENVAVISTSDTEEEDKGNQNERGFDVREDQDSGDSQDKSANDATSARDVDEEPGAEEPQETVHSDEPEEGSQKSKSESPDIGAAEKGDKDEIEEPVKEPREEGADESGMDEPVGKPPDEVSLISAEPITSTESEPEAAKDDEEELHYDPGSDPDMVAGEKLPEQALKAVGVEPGTKHEGSIRPFLESSKEVDLASLSLTPEQVEEVATFVDGNENVSSVTLRNTKLNDSSIAKLADVLKNNSCIKMLNLNVNEIGPEGAKSVAGIVTENKALKLLLMHGNPLNDEGVGYMVDAITETTGTSLQNIDLGDCGIGDEGAAHIARLLENNRTIGELTISGNSIGIEGWRKIGNALKSNSTLRTLSLDFNKIGDAEASAIAEGIRVNRTLRSVDVEANRIGDEGGRKLLEAVKENTCLVDLTLMPMNKISQSIVDEVREVLRERVKSRPGLGASGQSNELPLVRSEESSVEGQHGSPEEVSSDEAKKNEPPSESPQEKEPSSESPQEKEPSSAEAGATSEASSPAESTEPLPQDSGELEKDSAELKEKEPTTKEPVQEGTKEAGAEDSAKKSASSLDTPENSDIAETEQFGESVGDESPVLKLISSDSYVQEEKPSDQGDDRKLTEASGEDVTSENEGSKNVTPLKDNLSESEALES